MFFDWIFYLIVFAWGAVTQPQPNQPHYQPVQVQCINGTCGVVWLP